MTKRRWQPDFPFSPARLPFFYGWIIVLAGTAAVIFSIPGQTMGFSVFTDILMEQLGLSRVQLSSAYFVGTVLSGFRPTPNSTPSPGFGKRQASRTERSC